MVLVVVVLVLLMMMLLAVPGCPVNSELVLEGVDDFVAPHGGKVGQDRAVRLGERLGSVISYWVSVRSCRDVVGLDGGRLARFRLVGVGRYPGIPIRQPLPSSPPLSPLPVYPMLLFIRQGDEAVLGSEGLVYRQ